MVEHEVLLFAGLRQRAGRNSLRVETIEGCTVGDLLEAIRSQRPELGDLLSTCRVAVEQDFVEATYRLRGGEEIALIPPVSGGHGPPKISLGPDPLSLDAVVEVVRHRGSGGIATFTGQVRDRSRGHDVDHLEYEAYGAMAERVMAAIAADIEARIPGSAVAIHHRVGRLEIGDVAVVIAASAPHRAEAFAACREAIEALKRDVPIWKREVSPDGSEWIGQGP